jgi:two-component system invasion response regulator UvrY
MLAGGKSITEISETLVLSVKTVSTYRSRILEKLHLDNNAKLILYAIQNQLLK